MEEEFCEGKAVEVGDVGEGVGELEPGTTGAGHGLVPFPLEEVEATREREHDGAEELGESSKDVFEFGVVGDGFGAS